MTEQEIQDIVGHLGQQVSALSIDLAVERAKNARLERELAEGANSGDGGTG